MNVKDRQQPKWIVHDAAYRHSEDGKRQVGRPELMCTYFVIVTQAVIRSVCE